MNELGKIPLHSFFIYFLLKATIPNLDSDAFTRWSKTKLDRMMVDYFLRNGFSKTAETITKQAGIEVKLTNSMLLILAFFCRIL